jgi:hypothetical protein
MKYYFSKHTRLLGTLFAVAIMLSPLVSIAAAGSYNGSTGGTETLQNPLGGIDSICKLVNALLKAVMIIGVPIAVLFIVWAGFMFVLAQGNSEKLTKARSNFLYVIIGVGIFLGASLIASVIINTLTQLGVNGVNSC